MDLLIMFLAVAEIIGINIKIFDRNSTRKYSTLLTVGILVILSVIFFIGGLKVIQLSGHLGNGNGVFTMMGFLYLPVLKYLYQEKSYLRNFFIICCAWIYTLIIFSISVQSGYLLQAYGRYAMTLLVQTVLFLCTHRQMFAFMTTVYLKLEASTNKMIQKYLNRETFIWFLTIFSMNLNFVFENSIYIKIVFCIIMMINVLFSYQLLYVILSNGETIGSLESQVYRDALTHLGNRLGLEEQLQEFIKKEQSFVLIYMDLDNFKSINDEYGHLVGDEYLRYFAKRISGIGKEASYRISGDEFIILCLKTEYLEMLAAIQQIQFALLQSKVVFKGVSAGYALYPEDGLTTNELIYHADQRMYRDKKVR